MLVEASIQLSRFSSRVSSEMYLLSTVILADESCFVMFPDALACVCSVVLRTGFYIVSLTVCFFRFKDHALRNGVSGCVVNSSV